MKIISSGGGDVLKFAGDAMIVLWPKEDHESIELRLRRALQCAIYIQQKLHQVGPCPPAPLFVCPPVQLGVESHIPSHHLPLPPGRHFSLRGANPRPPSKTRCN